MDNGVSEIGTVGIVLVGIMLVGTVPVGIAPVGIGTCTRRNRPPVRRRMRHRDGVRCRGNGRRLGRVEGDHRDPRSADNV